jgi:hypothetical protein
MGQFMTLQAELASFEPTSQAGRTFGGQLNSQYIKHISLRLDSSPTHPVFNLLWSSKCQPKGRVFFCLPLHDKLNTRDRLEIRHIWP